MTDQKHSKKSTDPDPLTQDVESSSENGKEIPDLPPTLQFWEGSSHHVNQGRHWSSAIIWISSSLFTMALIWAFTAKIDQTISVNGRLEPTGSVREVDSPSGGVIGAVFVVESQLVNVGDPLFSVEAKGLTSKRNALEATKTLFQSEALSLKAILDSKGETSKLGPEPPLPDVEDPKLRSQLITVRQQSQQLRSRLEQLSSRLESKQETLKLHERISADLKPLFEAGGMARNEYLIQLNRVQENRAELSTLREERTRVMGQAASQLTQVDRTLLSLNAELVQLRETIDYRTVRAPIEGRVFDIQISPVSVINADQNVMKLVPDNRLQAQVSITNADIGFVQVGMPASVTVHSFPSGEFGYIYGKVESIGLDALKPDRELNDYRFPAKISLDQQIVEAGDKTLNLQSGMSVTANIKLRSRPVISIVSDLFIKQLDGVKRFR